MGIEQIRMSQTKALPPVPQFNWSQMELRSGKVVARKRASNDADVSTTSPIIPYGEFSPVRLEGWPFR